MGNLGRNRTFCCLLCRLRMSLNQGRNYEHNYIEMLISNGLWDMPGNIVYLCVLTNSGQKQDILEGLWS